MTKTVKNVYDKMLDKNLILQAIYNASKDKGSKKKDNKIDKQRKGCRYVDIVLQNIEYYVNDLYNILLNGTFKPSPYRTEMMKCKNKIRIIKKHDFYPDRCIEHAIAIVMLPKWSKVIRDCTYASWKGRGINAKNKKYDIIYQIKRAINTYKLVVVLYCLKFDIFKCYNEVDNDKLKVIVAIHCSDKRMLDLIYRFIDSCEGLPIGSYLSQLLINIYLTPLDNFITQTLGIKQYFRYMDDCIIFSHDKQFLHQVKYRIMNFLYYELSLFLNNKVQIFPVGYDRKGRAVDMCGYCFYRGFTLLRKSTKQNIKKKFDNIKSMASYKGLLINCESNNFIKSLGYDNIHELGYKENRKAF